MTTILAIDAAWKATEPSGAAVASMALGERGCSTHSHAPPKKYSPPNGEQRGICLTTRCRGIPYDFSDSGAETTESFHFMTTEFLHKFVMDVGPVNMAIQGRLPSRLQGYWKHGPFPRAT